MYKAVSESLPRDNVEKPDIRLQNRVLITNFLPHYYPDLATWYNGLSVHAKELLSEADRKTPPSGGGYVVTLAGFHYHDETRGQEFAYQPVGQQNYDPQQNLSLYGEGYLKRTSCRNFNNGRFPRTTTARSRSAASESPTPRLPTAHGRLSNI